MKKGFTALELIMVGVLLPLAVAGCWGWIANIAKLIHMDHLNGFMALRVVGVFMAPLGAVLGYF